MRFFLLGTKARILGLTLEGVIARLSRGDVGEIQTRKWAGDERLFLSCERCGDSWPPEERNSIWDQRRGLIAQSFCVIKFYLSVEEIEKASDIDFQRGQKEWRPASL